MQPLLIMAIGNPGPRYINTRHNAGTLFVQYILEKYHLHEQVDMHKKSNALVAKFTLATANPDDVSSSKNTRDIIFMQSQEFMNHSGKSVQAATAFFKVSPATDLLIIQDDLDITLGKFKFTHNRSAAGHNGIIDIIQKLGSQDFGRLRIGIDNCENPDRLVLPSREYVLKDFTSGEMEILNTVFDEAWSELQNRYVTQ